MIRIYALAFLFFTSCVTDQQLAEFNESAANVTKSAEKVEKASHDIKAEMKQLQEDVHKLRGEVESIDKRTSESVRGVHNHVNMSRQEILETVRKEHEDAEKLLVSKDTFDFVFKKIQEFNQRLQERVEKNSKDLFLENKNDERIATFLASVVQGFTLPLKQDLKKHKDDLAAETRAMKGDIDSINRKLVKADAKANMAQNRIEAADKAGGVVTKNEVDDVVNEKLKELTQLEFVLLLLIGLMAVMVLLYLLRAQIPGIVGMLPFMGKKKNGGGAAK